MKLPSEVKTILALCAVVLLTAGFAAAQEGEEPMTEEPTAEEPMAEEGGPSDVVKASYAIGLNIGRNMSQQGLGIDRDQLMAGLRDGLDGGDPAFSEEEMQAAMQTFQQRMMAEQQAERQRAAGDNAAAGQAFLAENAAREGVVATASGLQYEVEVAGEGAPPTLADQVVVHYRGKLLDGTEFDSSYSRGEPATFPLGGVIPGFSEGLQKFAKGGKGTLWIPGELAYGENGAPGGTIGPNATLVFEIELVDVLRADAPAADDEAMDGSMEAEPMDAGAAGDEAMEDGGSDS